MRRGLPFLPFAKFFDEFEVEMQEMFSFYLHLPYNLTNKYTHLMRKNNH